MSVWACVSVCTVVPVSPYLYSNALGSLQTIWISSRFSYINTFRLRKFVCMLLFEGCVYCIVLCLPLLFQWLYLSPHTFLYGPAFHSALHCPLLVSLGQTFRTTFHRQIWPISLVTVAWLWRALEMKIDRCIVSVQLVIQVKLCLWQRTDHLGYFALWRKDKSSSHRVCGSGALTETKVIK